MPRGGDGYGRTRHGGVVGDADMRDVVESGLGREDDTRVVGVVGEEDVVAVELVGVGEMDEWVGDFSWVASESGGRVVREGVDVSVGS